jgi:hydroxymethylpyrimidine/phosphomethylpyrimidine kinase
MRNEPLVLSLSGHDPTGGAGIQADIEAITATGGRACSVITAITVQDSVDVHAVLPQRREDFLAQAAVLLAEFPIAAIKIGLLGSPAIADAVADLLQRVDPATPVVIDPILAAGGGKELGGSALIPILRTRLLPRCTLLVPNTHEAARLGGSADLDACAAALLALGCENVLITGTHAASTDVLNRLYSLHGRRQYCWPRLPHDYHGSGCTLASACASYLAQGYPLEIAVELAQRYTWWSLKRGFRPGRGQHFPHRGMVPGRHGI